MSLPVVLRPEAQADLLDVRGYYDQHRAGLGDEFATAVEQFLARIAEMSELYAMALRSVRRGKVRRSPTWSTTESCLIGLRCLLWHTAAAIHGCGKTAHEEFQ